MCVIQVRGLTAPPQWYPPVIAIPFGGPGSNTVKF